MVHDDSPHILCDADPFALLCSRPALPGGTEQIPRAASADALQPRADTVLSVKGGAGCAGRYGRKALYDGRVDVIAFKTTLHIVFSLIFPKDCCSWICRREPAHFGRMRKEFGQRKEVPWCRTWDNWVDECSIRAAKELELEFLIATVSCVDCKYERTFTISAHVLSERQSERKNLKDTTTPLKRL